MNATLFPHNVPYHTSAWVFPPPVDVRFLSQWQNQHGPSSNSTADVDFEVDAVKNMTGSYVTQKDFGYEDAVVHVGDVLDVWWRRNGQDSEGKGVVDEAEERSVWMRCLVCSSGVQKYRDAEKGTMVEEGVFAACSGYTDTAHVSQFVNITRSLPLPASYTIPPLSDSFILPEVAVGICYFVLSDAAGMATIDYSVPFPVAQAKRADGIPFRFFQMKPQGAADPSLVYSDADDSDADSDDEEHSDETKKGLSTAAKTGTAIGVISAVLLSVAAGWWSWRREKRRGLSKNGAGDGGARIEMQPVQPGGVERRVEEDEDGEAPPAYNEVVKNDMQHRGHQQ